jgi:hypothetical protein
MSSEREIRRQLGWNLVWPEGEQLIVRRIKLARCLDMRTLELRVWHPVWRSVRNQALTQIRNQAQEDCDDR